MYECNRKKPFKVERVAERIFLANFTNQYDLAMTFCRYQEYYESPSEDFRRCKFKLIDFMEYYSKKFGKGGFTYAKDWVGFNVPGKVISECYLQHADDRRYASNDCDLNRYDEWMWDIVNKCYDDGDDYYLIGTVGNESSTFSHELAHGLYYTNPAYKFEMNQLVAAMDDADRNEVFKYLKKIGYAEEYFKDETQAYFSTGLTKPLDKTHLQRYIVNFEAVFNKRATAKKVKNEK